MAEPQWLTREEVDAMQSYQIREHGGKPGVRDGGLIDSALARSRQKHSYDSDVDLAGLAAAYAFGLARNHGYLDGNKRIGLIAAYAFLLINGWELEAQEAEAVEIMQGVAGSSVTEGQVAAWIRSRLIPYVG